MRTSSLTNRRHARWTTWLSLVLSFAVPPCAFANEPIVGLPCERCEAVFVGMPANLNANSRIAPSAEPGEAMLITGYVFGKDGKSRANVVVYAYHTDARGIYPPPEKSLGKGADRHGRLRGWALTDAHGRYSFQTIRPASYPTGGVPAHVHMHVIERGCATYYIDDILFTDDPLITRENIREHKDSRGGSGFTTPQRDRDKGPWRVKRDIQLGLNIPGYPDCGSR